MGRGDGEGEGVGFQLVALGGGVDTVIARRDGRIGRILLNRPKALNAIDLPMIRAVRAAVPVPVIASGGVSSLADIRAIASLRPLGVEGAIIGKALYSRAFTLERALAVVGT